MIRLHGQVAVTADMCRESMAAAASGSSAAVMCYVRQLHNCLDTEADALAESLRDLPEASEDCAAGESPAVPATGSASALSHSPAGPAASST